MGSVRLVLALAVVGGHLVPSIGARFLPAPLAVECFFMISGFLTAFILAERFQPGRRGTRSFWANRALRLFPLYWGVALLSLGVSLALWRWVDDSGFLYGWKLSRGAVGPGAVAYLGLSQAAILFLDAAMFLAVDPATGALSWTTNFNSAEQPLHLFLLVPQAWTLGIEILFYSVAPWLLRLRSPALLATAGASALIRFWLLPASGLTHDPWTYRFWPSELLLFLGGAASYRYLYRTETWKRIEGRLRTTGLGIAALGAVTLGFALRPFSWNLTFVAMFAALPGLFVFSRRHAWDRRLGDLSYPVYLNHLLVILLVRQLVSPESVAGACAIVACSLLAAWTMDLAETPFTRWRRTF